MVGIVFGNQPSDGFHHVRDREEYVLRHVSGTLCTILTFVGVDRAIEHRTGREVEEVASVFGSVHKDVPVYSGNPGKEIP